MKRAFPLTGHETINSLRVIQVTCDRDTNLHDPGVKWALMLRIMAGSNVSRLIGVQLLVSADYALGKDPIGPPEAYTVHQNGLTFAGRVSAFSYMIRTVRISGRFNRFAHC